MDVYKFVVICGSSFHLGWGRMVEVAQRAKQPSTGFGDELLFF